MLLSNQPASWEECVLFLLQRDACEESTAAADSLLAESLHTAHHLQLQDLQLEKLLARVLIEIHGAC